MKTQLLGLTLFLATLIASPLHAQGIAPEEVQALADQWTAAYNEHDAEALGAVYSEDAHLYLHASPRIEGRENIQVFWEGDMTDDNPITLLTVTHYVDGADMILVHGNYQVISRDNGTQLGYGRFAHIWELDIDGNWELDRDLWNQPFIPYAE